MECGTASHVATPLDANRMLSKKDCPQVVDPALHRVVHLQAAEWILQYVCGTYDHGLIYFDPGNETKNKVFRVDLAHFCSLLRDGGIAELLYITA